MKKRRIFEYCVMCLFPSCPDQVTPINIEQVAKFVAAVATWVTAAFWDLMWEGFDMYVAHPLECSLGDETMRFHTRWLGKRERERENYIQFLRLAKDVAVVRSGT